MRLFSCLALLSLAVGAPPQTISGSIAATVRDPSGLAIAGAEVTLQRPFTGAKRTALTDERGAFAISPLQPGSYDVTVKSAGFKTVERTGIGCRRLSRSGWARLAWRWET